MTDVGNKPKAVVSTDSARISPLARLRRPIVFVPVLVVVIIIVVAGLLMVQKDGANNDAVDPNDPVNKINKLAANQGDEKVQQEILKDKDVANSRDGKLLLASSLINQGKDDEALAVYLDIAKNFGWSADVAKQVAIIYSIKGDEPKALEHYQKSLELYRQDTDNPLRDSEVERLERIITEMKE